jgi:transcriptional regulator with XRE-family HTH domain
MTYQPETFGPVLRAARRRKGWSQRDLSERAHIPQAHISRIESGAVDMKLSTLTQVARLLDLDLVVAPRTALTAIEALIREAEANDEARTVRGAANILDRLATKLRLARPKDPMVERLAELARALVHIGPLFRSQDTLSELAAAVAAIEAFAGQPDPGSGDLRPLVRRLAKLRDALVHPEPAALRPAYSLDDED